MINKNRLVRTFIELVKIDSLSGEEGEVLAYLKRELIKLRIHPYLAGGNLAADLKGEGPKILLNAHVDTVSPGTGIKPIQAGGYIKSNGKTVLGADNKAGVAAILEILKVLKEKGGRRPNLRVIFTIAEEIGLVGAKALPKSLLKADFGIVLDGGDINKIINQAPTQFNLIATIIGRAAHAGLHPEKGINAIKIAGLAVSRMKLGRIDHETTANIGVIQGGRATNIVPDKVEIKGEARSHDPKKLKKQIQQMEDVLKRACRQNGAKLKLRITQMYKAFKIDEREPILRSAVSAVKMAGIKPLIKRTGGGSDANIFNAAGVPSIIMGVGADHVHTTAERIRVDNLVKGTQIVLNLLKGLSHENT